MSLLVDWCSYEAAKYAVMHWHYSGKMPRSKMNTLGVWEDEKYVGCIVFSYGATPQIGSPYCLEQIEIVELTRVALKKHNNTVTRMLSKSMKMLKDHNSKLRMVVSFADSDEGHLGIIYQASNWIYAGRTKPGRVGFIVNGDRVHTRTIGLMPNGVQSLAWVKENVDPGAREWFGTEKHRYLYPLDKGMRRKILPLAQPYPKNAGKVSMRDTPTVQVGEAGSIPAVRSDMTGQEPELVE